MNTATHMIHKFNMSLVALVGLISLAGCYREPDLHLPHREPVHIVFTEIDLDLQTFWDYRLNDGTVYDWQAEWYYGWDEWDQQHFGPLGYVSPNLYQLRRYYTRDVANGPHVSVIPKQLHERSSQDEYSWGFWDLLVWSEVEEDEQNLLINENSLDYVTATTNASMRSARYQAPAYTRSFNQPEQLFSAYETAVEINKNLDGFVYDAENNIWVKEINMLLRPLTYIYLTQVILHNNRKQFSGGKATGTDAIANFSAMAQATNLNSGVTGTIPITVDYATRFKKDCDMEGEKVDIVGGRVMTFGICGQNNSQITLRSDVHDEMTHYMDVNLQFYNGTDSTLVFDVTEQVRNRWKGGVITVELDMDTVKAPTRGGSSFDAVVVDFEDGGTHEISL